MIDTWCVDHEHQLKTFLPASPPPKKGPEVHVISIFQPGILFWQLQNIQISEKHPLFESWHSLIPGH